MFKKMVEPECPIKVTINSESKIINKNTLRVTVYDLNLCFYSDSFQGSFLYYKLSYRNKLNTTTNSWRITLF